MAAAAGLSVTLVPIPMGYWIRGRIPEETRNPLNRGLIHLYRPLLDRVLDRPILTIVVAGFALLSTAWPLSHLGGEFMPPLEQGDLLYMPQAATSSCAILMLQYPTVCDLGPYCADSARTQLAEI
jgi:Cu(I)/Ag(I) efflux system membrane protein CusA/SilA